MENIFNKNSKNNYSHAVLKIWSDSGRRNSVLSPQKTFFSTSQSYNAVTNGNLTHEEEEESRCDNNRWHHKFVSVCGTLTWLDIV